MICGDIMPTPKRKLSRARIRSRSAHKGIQPQIANLCDNKACGEAKMPHAVCLSCGFYRGEKVLKTKSERAVVRAEKEAKKKTEVRSEGE